MAPVKRPRNEFLDDEQVRTAALALHNALVGFGLKHGTPFKAMAINVILSGDLRSVYLGCDCEVCKAKLLMMVRQTAEGNTHTISQRVLDPIDGSEKKTKH